MNSTIRRDDFTTIVKEESGGILPAASLYIIKKDPSRFKMIIKIDIDTICVYTHIYERT